MEHQTGNRKWWLILGFIVFLGFVLLSQQEAKLCQSEPPVSEAVVAEAGEGLFLVDGLLGGQNIWQSMDGQEGGLAWECGTYVAPNWTADWLHRESLYALERWGEWAFYCPYSSLAPAEQANLRTKLVQELRANTYNKATGRLTRWQGRADEAKAMPRYSSIIFSNAPDIDAEIKPLTGVGKTPPKTRKRSTIANNRVQVRERLRRLGAFFFLGKLGECGSSSTKGRR